eukprot:613958-Rhodomonas_salina.1
MVHGTDSDVLRPGMDWDAVNRYWDMADEEDITEEVAPLPYLLCAPYEISSTDRAYGLWSLWNSRRACFAPRRSEMC